MTKPEVPSIALNDGRTIPQLGIGAWQISDRCVPDVVGTAIKAGYRLIDTAANYHNEAGVGRAVRLSSVSRHEIHVTTKLWNDSQGYDQALRAFDASLANLGLEWVDLYLIHWPCPHEGAYVSAWQALIELRKQGRAKSIGVSNFAPDHLERIIHETGVVPAVNQVELHPYFQQRSLREFHGRYKIITQAWSPLGRGDCLSAPAVRTLADRHRRSPAQVVLRWHLENGVVAIPKSATPSRIAENIAVFDFELSQEDHLALASLDRPDGRLGPDPATFGQRGLVRRLNSSAKTVLRSILRHHETRNPPMS